MLYIAIVSHGHFEIINELNCISKLSALDDVQIIVKDNVGEIKLKEYCKKYNIMYFDDKKGLGFGANNNFIFNKICHDANDNDYFLVMNPDVFIECDELLKFKKNIDTNDYSCVTINLYKDYCYKQFDNAIRKFPTLLTFIKSFLFGINDSIEDKLSFDKIQEIEWCAGSFIAFDIKTYRSLGGFDEKYFMYCEDIDLCWRVKYIINKKIYCLSDIKAIHLARFNNRKMLSKHFFWHVKSIMIFLSKTYMSKYFRGQSNG